MGDNYKPYESTINIDWHYSITLNMIEGVIIVCPNTRLDKQRNLVNMHVVCSMWLPMGLCNNK